MREIKFRAWCKHREEMINWDRLQTSVYAERGMGWWNDPDLIVMQYTGLKDKNGTEIYEGDIVLIDLYCAKGTKSEILGKVAWDKPFAGFGIECVDDSEHCLDLHMGTSVIGNIYENPELLESKQ